MELIIILLFILLLIVEGLFSIQQNTGYYTKQNTLENLGIAFISFMADYGFSILSYPAYLYIYKNWSVCSWQNELLYFVMLFFLLDFLEYWFHRLSHTIPLFWAAHKVHHQSNEFNLTVGLRTSFLVPLLNAPFYGLLPLIGFHPLHVLLFVFLQGVYQLAIHTRYIKKHWLWDRIIVTPSVHRVHHGVNKVYHDKNYGKVLVLWDQLFGTWKWEKEDVRYGVTDDTGEKGIVRAQIMPLRKWWCTRIRKI